MCVWLGGEYGWAGAVVVVCFVCLFVISSGVSHSHASLRIGIRIIFFSVSALPFLVGGGNRV